LLFFIFHSFAFLPTLGSFNLNHTYSWFEYLCIDGKS
jgi:hypothetical protein